MKGAVISIEGINGVGKSYYEYKLRNEIYESKPPLFISEISDRTGENLDVKILKALSYTNDRFFRMGFPMTEMFLLLAMKIYDFEKYMIGPLNEGRVIIEDRSIDTIAIYQSIMQCKNEPDKALIIAKEIYDIAARYRRPPTLTFLLEDDINTSIERAQLRNGEIYSHDQIEIIYNAAKLYPQYAELYKERFVSIDLKKMNSAEVLEIMKYYIIKIIESYGRK